MQAAHWSPSLQGPTDDALNATPRRLHSNNIFIIALSSRTRDASTFALHYRRISGNRTQREHAKKKTKKKKKEKKTKIEHRTCDAPRSSPKRRSHPRHRKTQRMDAGSARNAAVHKHCTRVKRRRDIPKRREKK